MHKINGGGGGGCGDDKERVVSVTQSYRLMSRTVASYCRN